MIRYEVDPDSLLELIEDRVPGWLTDANTTTNELLDEGVYSDKKLSWGDVKPTFMEIQANKCIFCEQQMEGERI